MTPAEIRQIFREELQRARTDIVAEAKRHATGNDLEAEATVAAALVHERTAMRTHVAAVVAPLKRKLDAIVGHWHWTRNPWVDLLVKFLAFFAAAYAAVTAAQHGP